jgi:hypothetical protein
MKVWCPDTVVLATDGEPIMGCGHEWYGEPDDEGWFDCPSCGLMFSPAHPENARPDAEG